MHFIKYFLVFALFAIQLSVQKPNYADVITYEAYGSPGGHGYKDETTFNLLGSDGTRGSAGETTYEYVAGPAPTFDKSKNCSNVLDCALKSGVADAGKEFLENNLGDSYEVKRKKVEIVYLIVYLVAKNVDEKPKNNRKSKSRFNSDENETLPKKKSSCGYFAKNFKNKVVGGVKDGIKKKLTKSLLSKLF